ncbi:sensor histidine kinase [Paenibacillus cisolokensis]
MAPDTAALAVPRMVLQPLVENVFKHAFDPVGGQIRVWISTFRQGRHAAIQVEDDGPGIPEAKLQELRTLLDEIENRKSKVCRPAAKTDISACTMSCPG